MRTGSLLYEWTKLMLTETMRTRQNKLRIPHVQKQHVSPENVGDCIIHIIFTFQTRVMTGCIFHAVLQNIPKIFITIHLNQKWSLDLQLQ